LPDTLGSTRQLVNAAGQIMLAENYNPFGNTINSMGSDSLISGFTGQQTDPNRFAVSARKILRSLSYFTTAQ
jgi:hypothetical protein